MDQDEHPSLPAHLGPLSEAIALPMESWPMQEGASVPVAAARPAPLVAPAVAASGTLDAAQLGVLDSMMQAFTADGELTPVELQAYQAARASFLGEDPSPGAAQAGTAPLGVLPVESEAPQADDGHTTPKEALAAYKETLSEQRHTPRPLRLSHEVHQDPQMTPSERAHSQVASPADRPLHPVTPVSPLGAIDRI